MAQTLKLSTKSAKRLLAVTSALVLILFLVLWMRPQLLIHGPDPFVQPVYREPYADQSGGIGASISVGSSGMYLNAIQNGPAWEAGLKVTGGGALVELDGMPTRGMTTDQAINLLRGPAGSKVKLLIVARADELNYLIVERKPMQTIQNLYSSRDKDDIANVIGTPLMSIDDPITLPCAQRAANFLNQRGEDRLEVQVRKLALDTSRNLFGAKDSNTAIELADYTLACATFEDKQNELLQGYTASLSILKSGSEPIPDRTITAIAKIGPALAKRHLNKEAEELMLRTVAASKTSLDPFVPIVVRREYARTLRISGKTDRSIQQYVSIVDWEKKNPRSYELPEMLETMMEAKQFSQALPYSLQYATSIRTPLTLRGLPLGAMLSVAWLYHATGKMEEAKSVCRQAISEYDDYLYPDEDYNAAKYERWTYGHTLTDALIMLSELEQDTAIKSQLRNRAVELRKSALGSSNVLTKECLKSSAAPLGLQRYAELQA